MIKTLTLQEFKDHFEAMIFAPNQSGRIDLQFNSQVPAKGATEEKKEEGKEEAKEAEPAEPDPEVSHETERKHDSIPLFKKSMRLLPDVFSNAYVNLDTKL